MGPPGLPGKRGQRVGHCVFGLGVLAVLCCAPCERELAGACFALCCRACGGLCVRFWLLPPLVKCVCVFLLAGGGGWWQAGQREMPGT